MLTMRIRITTYPSTTVASTVYADTAPAVVKGAAAPSPPNLRAFCHPNAPCTRPPHRIVGKETYMSHAYGRARHNPQKVNNRTPCTTDTYYYAGSSIPELLQGAQIHVSQITIITTGHK